jgi:hypothetical protein
MQSHTNIFWSLYGLIYLAIQSVLSFAFLTDTAVNKFSEQYWSLFFQKLPFYDKLKGY